MHFFKALPDDRHGSLCEKHLMTVQALLSFLVIVSLQVKLDLDGTYAGHTPQSFADTATGRSLARTHKMNYSQPNAKLFSTQFLHGFMSRLPSHTLFFEPSGA